ncbi:MAG: hypothetical protein HYY85_02780 [Deltaproteobacteria bacterium]|nr:hypothetical protein [Deltaproteobacteria bacterium]
MRRQGAQGQSQPWTIVAIALVLVVGLGVGYLTWGRRVSRLEQTVRSLEQDMDKIKADTFNLRQDLVARRMFGTEGGSAQATGAPAAPTPAPASAPPVLPGAQTSSALPGVQILTFHFNGIPSGAPIAEFP